MIVGASEELVPGGVVGDLHQRLVGCRLGIIPVSRALGKAVELCADDAYFLLRHTV